MWSQDEFDAKRLQDEAKAQRPEMAHPAFDFSLIAVRKPGYMIEFELGQS
jgi:hypothetical protein